MSKNNYEKLINNFVELLTTEQLSDFILNQFIGESKWEESDFNYRCSECKTYTSVKYPFCPYCGAKMDSHIRMRKE